MLLQKYKNHVSTIRLQDNSTIKLRYERFVKTTCETSIVYGLKSEEGFATSSSNSEENENEEPIGIICFWSEKAVAKSCIKNEWEEYQVTEISLSAFIENWCIGMHNDNLLAGINFDQNMFGYEINPLALILDLINQLRQLKLEIIFTKFDNIDDLDRQVRNVIGNNEIQNAFYSHSKIKDTNLSTFLSLHSQMLSQPFRPFWFLHFLSVFQCLLF